MPNKPRQRNDDMIKLVGRNIRKIRKSKGLSMERLSCLMNVDYSQVSNMELGKKDPTLSMLLLVAEQLGVSLEQLFEKD